MKKDNFDYYYKEEDIHPGFSVDCVIFSFHKRKLQVLLRKFALEDYWSLLGGFMYNHEDSEQAAYRILEHHTGTRNMFLRQFHLFSDPTRTDMEQNKNYINRNASSEEEGKWLLRRFITMGYYALVKYDNVKLSAAPDESLKWYDIQKLPHLQSDHENIIKTALKTIRAMLPVIPIGYELLPEKFTMTELRKIYEIIMEKEFDRRNFQRKILSEGSVVQLDETVSGKTYNPPILYSFRAPDMDKELL
ncbi:NUDIX domain-containing protein [Dysgonomonas sp. 25]|uniref:NUDIX hydrolase n=1 Tax=Dysgonomonas sp. 25 TaxID=2302933 RepID=UPI0013CF761F|nr:NUDIX domain-containing protein [Dysgonomonas sp. 25]NDV70148.1 NUDIX domain-containing protein [Dysgonomonas sp. 25]